MPIAFEPEKAQFVLTTDHTAYLFRVVAGRYLMHTYYGKKEGMEQSFKADYHSFSPYHEDCGMGFSFCDDLSEFSFFGSGDFRCSSIRVAGSNGDSCTSFAYQDYEVFQGRKEIPGIPFARAQEDTQTLAVRLADAVTGCVLTLFYTLFPSFDFISRSFRLENAGAAPVELKKAMSLCLDLPGHAFDLLTLYGAHNGERNLQRTPLFYGNARIMSRRGASSHQFNPFLALAAPDATEDCGDVYGFNLMYSGCFLDEVEVDQGGNTRVGIGLGEENFSYRLESGESFASPEAFMLFTPNGLGEISRKMHAFVRTAIAPPELSAHRPVVLNTWEACYFDINEDTLLRFAKEGAALGMDMLVMDDGWFGLRNDDRAALGDWVPNPAKFPNGLKNFVTRVKATGIRFGIWIEPEMVNPDSNLYRQHPDWCLQCKGREPSLSRNQLVLDMANPAVLEYLKKSLAAALDGVGIDYIKWDFNRHLSEVGSCYLPKERQEETFYRFQMGVYALYDWLIGHFPGVMLENCSGGGGRYDLPMMALSTQIWTSDNTNATDRVLIQYGSSMGYPASVMSCHVSDPGQGTDALQRLDYKYKVALGGVLGYELNILQATDAVKQQIKKQIAWYRQVELLIRNGDLYRLLSPFENNNQASAYYYAATAATGENPGSRLLLSYLQNRGTDHKTTYRFRLRAAIADAVYLEKVTGKRYKGSELIDGFLVEASDRDQDGRVWLFEKQ